MTRGSFSFTEVTVWRITVRIGQKLMPAAMMVSGVGFILIGAAAFIGDCRAAVLGGDCDSTTIGSLLQEANLFYYDGASGRILNDLMFLPFSYVALAFGAVVFMAGAGIGSLRGL